MTEPINSEQILQVLEWAYNLGREDQKNGITRNTIDLPFKIDGLDTTKRIYKYQNISC